jgi:hypothetical protein
VDGRQGKAATVADCCWGYGVYGVDEDDDTDVVLCFRLADDERERGRRSRNGQKTPLTTAAEDSREQRAGGKRSQAWQLPLPGKLGRVHLPCIPKIFPLSPVTSNL